MPVFFVSGDHPIPENCIPDISAVWFEPFDKLSPACMFAVHVNSEGFSGIGQGPSFSGSPLPGIG